MKRYHPAIERLITRHGDRISFKFNVRIPDDLLGPGERVVLSPAFIEALEVDRGEPVLRFPKPGSTKLFYFVRDGYDFTRDRAEAEDFFRFLRDLGCVQ